MRRLLVALGILAISVTSALGQALPDTAIRVITGHGNRLRDVTISPDGQKLISASDDATIRIWGMPDGTPIRTLTGHIGPVTSVVVGQDGQTIVSGGDDFTVRVWNASTGALIRTLTGHTSYVIDVALSPDGQTIVSASYDQTLKVWRLSDGALLRTLVGHTQGVWNVAITPDGESAVSVSADNTVRIWRLSDGACLQTLTGHEGIVYAVDIADDGQVFVSGGLDQTIRLWQLPGGEYVRTFVGHTNGIHGVAIAPGGQECVSGSLDRTVRVWRLSDGALLRTLVGHTGDVLSVAVSPDGQYCVSGGSYGDSTIRMWRLANPPAGTPISGVVPTSTWTAANSPFRVTGAITVPTGNTLTIEPGVDVLFDADVQFIVQGKLRAVGTEADSIRFLKGTANEWGGVRIRYGDSSTFAYARISGGHAHGDWPHFHGGGIYLAGPTAKLFMSHSVLSGNSSDEYAGGLMCDLGATATLTRCRITGNTASMGGGIFSDGSNTTLTQCTISANVASNGGSGLYNKDLSTIMLTNSIVWGNTPIQQIAAPQGVVLSTYSDIQGGWPGIGNIDANPLFSTHPDSAYHLTPTSPCINTGDPSFPLDPNGTRVEMGAFYFPYTITNRAPHWSARPDTSIDEGISLTFLVSATDPDGQTLSYRASALPTNATFDTTSRVFYWMPGYDMAGIYDVQFRVSDGEFTVYDTVRVAVRDMTTTAIWTKTNSPYRVSGTITVPTGNTLTIEPGVDVLFDADVQFVVRGRLEANGTETDSIRFLPGTASEWGGIRISGGDLSTIAYARIEGGHAHGVWPHFHGGGIYLAGPTTQLFISNSVLSGNSSEAYAGGLMNDLGATVTLTDCRITGNSAGMGGGVYSFGSNTTLTNCTISGNNASEDVGGLFVSSSSIVTLTNTIVWGNISTQQIAVSQSVFSATYSDIQGGWPGIGNIDADPLFVNAAAGNYALLPGSPCIDTGDPASPPDPDFTQADIGAFPTDFPPAAPTDLYAENAGAGTVYLDWSGGGEPDFAGFRIYYDPVAATTSSPYVETTENWTEIGELTPRTTYQFAIAARDAAGNESALSDPFSFVAPSERPEVAINTGAYVAPSGTVTITRDMLRTTDDFTPPDSIVYTVDIRAPSAGTLRLDGTDLAVESTFTQADIDAGLLTYEAGAAEVVDDFLFIIADGEEGNEIYEQRFDLTITSAAPPVLTKNAGIAIPILGMTATIDSSMLKLTDLDTSPSELTYTLLSSPAHGTLRTFEGIVVRHDDPYWTYFTQDAIDLGALTYEHDGQSAEPDSFLFTISDGTYTFGPYTFAIAVDTTLIAGEITTRTWTAANSPYRVVGDVIVPAGETLTIEPGVDVLFDADVRFFVEGRIVAVGTEIDSIRFLPAAALVPGGNAEWGGILIFGFGGQMARAARTEKSSRWFDLPRSGSPAPAARAARTAQFDTCTFAYVRISGANRAWDGISEPGPDVFGGGLLVMSRTEGVRVSHSVISGNVGGLGGGVCVIEAPLLLDNTRISGNTATASAGGIAAGPWSYLEVDRCAVVGNAVNGLEPSMAVGGGIYTEAAIVRIANTLVAGNSVTSAFQVWTTGGGIYAYAGEGEYPLIVNCTIADNAADQFGGINSDGFVSNTIFRNNGGMAVEAQYVSFSDIEGMDGWEGSGNDNIDADPLFVDAAAGDYRLSFGSPCIDAGDPESPPDPDGSRADMGAFSFAFDTVATTTWIAANSPYRISRPLLVPVGETLTIEPGVDVLFDADVPFIVEGRIVGVGTETDSIRFLPGLASEWRGIRFGIVNAEPQGLPARPARSGKTGNSPQVVRATGARVARTAQLDSSALAYVRISGANNALVDGEPMPETFGGGIALWNPNVSLALDHVVVRGNRAYFGGGIAIEAGVATLAGCEVAGNVANGDGGGIYLVSGGALTAADSRIAENTAGGYGGGFEVYSTGTVLALERCEIRGNSAGDDAGGVDIYDGATGELTDCVIADNTGYDGGGIWSNTNLTLTRCLVAGNVSPGGESGGGGAYISDAVVAFESCTITGNSAPGQPGDGLLLQSGAIPLAVVAILHNTILRGNGTTDFAPYELSPGAIEATYSDVAGIEGEGNIDADPLFADAATGDYHLLPGSPCINAGDPASPLDPDGTRADMGAYTYAAYGVYGTIETTTWTAANSPYRVTGTITIPTGNTLTIEPGVDVLFDADVQFIVQGRLAAIGTEADSIRFLKGVAAEWGGLRISGGDSSTIAYARISDGYANLCTDCQDNAGGGITVGENGVPFSAHSRLGLSNSVIRGNRSYGGAGGIQVANDAHVTLVNCSIENNIANGGPGGGIHLVYSAVEIVDCRIVGNTASGTPGGQGGGGISSEFSNLSVDRSVIALNSTLKQGGGISSIESIVDVRHCTLFGNIAQTGGGYFGSSASPALMANCIFWNDSQPEFMVGTGAVPTVAYSDVQGGWTGTGNISADPLFVDAASGDYHLLDGSPCIDAGDPASPLDPDYTRADMGAYPYVHPLMWGDVNHSGYISAMDASLVLRHVVRLVDLDPIARLAADVSGNGQIRSYDASFILARNVGLIECFPVEQCITDRPALTGGEIALGSAVAGSGGRAFMPIALAGARGVTALTVEIPLDTSAVAFDSVACALPAGWIAARAFSGGMLRIVMAGPEPRADGTIATLALALRRPQDGAVAISATGAINEAPLADLGVATIAPLAFALGQNAPNPFNPETAIRFDIAVGGDVELAIYDANGRTVRTLVAGSIAAGAHEVVWDGRDSVGREVASGAYLYRLAAPEGMLVRRMVLVR